MTSFTVRRATVDDAAPLSELAARTFAETFGPDNDPEDLADYLRSNYGVSQQTAEILDTSTVTLLAYVGQQLAGYAQIRRKAAPACVVSLAPVELHRFYVVRTAQGSGLARLLMTEARKAARQIGGRDFWLGVWERNPRAIAFYGKSGFTEVGSHVFMVGSDAQRDLVLVSPLGTNASAA